MALGIVREFATRENAPNRLHNGGFEFLHYSHEPYVYPPPSGFSNSSFVTFEKQLRPKEEEITDTPTPNTVPYWRVYCTENLGAVISYSPIDKNTGFRVWSRDGGNVLVIGFLKSCSLVIEQDVYPFTEFPMNPVTNAFSGYEISGNVRVETSFNFGEEDKNSIVSFSDSFGTRRRLVRHLNCPGKMSKMTYKITLTGKEGDSVGLSGLMVALGDYEVELPYAPNFMDFELHRGTVIAWEDTEPPLGYEFIDHKRLVFQALSDPNALDNIGAYEQFSGSASVYGPQQIEISNELGSSNHNAHFSLNAFADADDVFNENYPYSEAKDSNNIHPYAYRYSGEAWRGVRIKNIDFNDIGYGWTGSGLSPSAGRRPPVLNWCISLGFYCGHKGGGGFLGTWDTFGIDPDGTGTGTPPRWVDEIPYSNIGRVQEFQKSTRSIIGLPCNPGRDETSGDSGFVDNWQHQHKHKLVNEGGDIFPPYRSFKLCRKL